MLDGVVHEELAMALSLNADIRGETVFQEVKTYFEKNQIPLTNVIACAGPDTEKRGPGQLTKRGPLV